jgi:hypothetical protein
MRQVRKLRTYVTAGFVDSGGIGNEEQLLPDVFTSPVRDGTHQRVQDFVPSLVIYKLDVLVVVQLRDHVGRRIEVVQTCVVSGKSLKVGSGCLCA